MHTPASEPVDDLSVLWQECEVGSTTVPNRIVFAAHGVGLRGDAYAAYLAERARGGTGLLISGASAVDPTSDAGLTWNAWQPEAVADMALAAAAVRAEGRSLFVQLSHAGAQFRGPWTTGEWGVLLSPSGVPAPFVGITPKAMERSDVERVVAGFARSAHNVRAAGAGGVEIHAAHGNLLCAFLSPFTNLRADDYGGGLEGRARLALEVGAAVRREVGADFTVGIKLSFDEFLGDAGITPAEAADTVRLLHAAGLFDYFGVTCGTSQSFRYVVVPASSGLSAHTADYGELARRAVDGQVPVMATGTVRTIEEAAGLVRGGAADLVGMIRAQIADPELVRKARDGRRRETRSCVGANQGCWRRMAVDGLVICTVNPATGREASWGTAAATRTGDPRGVLVVGGGPAGMRLAEVAASRGHRVTLLERARELGGQARLAGLLPRRDGWLQLVEDLAAALERLEVDVRLATDAEAGDVVSYEADATFVATGAVWDLDGASAGLPGARAIPRADGSHVVDPVVAVEQPGSCGQAVTIVDGDGGYLPLGLAELLAGAGRSVTIATPAADVGGKLGVAGTLDLDWVRPRLVEAGVSIAGATRVERIEAGHVVLAAADGARRERASDTVVLVTGRRADDALYAALRGEGVNVHRIGDCLAPREIDDAIFEGTREGHDVEARVAAAAAATPAAT